MVKHILNLNISIVIIIIIIIIIIIMAADIMATRKTSDFEDAAITDVSFVEK